MSKRWRISPAAPTHPWRAFGFAAMLFSLAGVPPLAGFFAKFYVFSAAIGAGLYTLSVIGVVTSVIGAFYYLRIVKVMYFDEPKGAFERMPSGAEAVLLVTTVVVALFWLIPSPLVTSAGVAARSLF